jgi:D-lyxose ketol-isomerase
MLTLEQFHSARERTLRMLRDARISITPEETERIEVADFGLGDLDHVGLQLLTYVNTERVCAKELVLFPGQTCPEHLHPPVAGEPGKEETFRCRWGEVYLYVPGEAAKEPKAKLSPENKRCFTVWHEVVLRPGEQHTLFPETLHWFQGGPQGAVVSEFSTRSRDEHDVFTDPRIVRQPQVEKR